MKSRFKNFIIALLALIMIVPLVICQPAKAQVTLHWTAPGDDADSGGACARYEIRMAEGDSTDFDWNSATIIPNNMIPQLPGETESFTINDLSTGHKYCFAVMPFDEAENAPYHSNISCKVVVDMIAPAAISNLWITQP